MIYGWDTGKRNHSEFFINLLENQVKEMRV
jgi:hypothetical protein